MSERKLEMICRTLIWCVAIFSVAYCAAHGG